MNKEKPKNLHNAIKSNIYILSIAFKLCPPRVIMDIAVNLMSKLVSFYFLLIIETLVKGLQRNEAFDKLVLIVVINSFVLLVIKGVQCIYNEKTKLIYDQILIERMNLMVFGKAFEADISCYEDAEFYDNYTKAAAEANGRIIKVIDTISNILSGIVVAVCYLIKLATIDYFSVIIVLMPVLATSVMGKRLKLLDYKLTMENVSHNRKKDYVKRTVYLQKYAKELRLYPIFSVLQEIFNEAVENIIKNIKKYCYPMMGFRLFQRLFAGSLPTIGFMIYKVYKSIREPAGISDFTVLFYGVLSLSGAMEVLLYNLITLRTDSLYIDNLKQFLNHSPSIKNEVNAIPVPERIESIEFVNVSFSYPNSDRPVLHNINLKLHMNRYEKVSIVGHNGSGKTTFVKLILRLYDPTEGEIRLNGINIKAYDLKEYRKAFGTVFQDFNIFSMSAAENVLMEDAEPGKENLVKKSLEKSGILDKVLTLKKGIYTMLTREFDEEGEVLSGGQNQKIAIARAFAANSNVLIMDEPSSALDPIAEDKIWDSLIEVSRGKGAIFISHRMSACKLADKIYLMERGCITEQGSHEELINYNGKYADMFKKQAMNYQSQE
ncbi:ABC transporter ATP-binding protein [Anaerocolumna cellulosilytica]|uniref:ABC transporter ATP-binding protein n=1 Tax=Anaerocolumna cellulosilytica TaxID=433286 RepID=A0A6S6R0Z0_9FIRM|nr:ABC transporter ATP-binding protein [Anaerocolumna cellulosilytica]MBB5195975.1 ATP-binding cassette subfamily B protein [Anaerocolumna cellulosilytica]BCJ93727.1 ABC transporter ATP-binding protein [Anaerocolumna cellulosilytica]